MCTARVRSSPCSASIGDLPRQAQRLGHWHRTLSSGAWRRNSSARGAAILVSAVTDAPLLPSSAQAIVSSVNNIAPAGLPPRILQSSAVTTVHSSEEFNRLLEDHPNELVVLMCKAMGCRPCKMFSRKFQRLAETYPNAVLCDIMGDESKETRKMMIGMDVKVTPTFRFYLRQDGAPRCVHVMTGINENNLRAAVAERLPSVAVV